MLGDLKAGAAGIVCLALGLLSGGVIVQTYDAWFIIPEAERVAIGRADARWQKQIDDAKAEAETARQVAQAEIDAVERDYHARETDRLLAMTALEQALEEEQARAPIPTPADRGAPCVCRPPVSRGVRDALQGLGRATARPGSAKPVAAVRGSR